MKKPTLEQRKELSAALVVITRVALMYKAGLVSMLEASSYAMKVIDADIFKTTDKDFTVSFAQEVPRLIIKVAEDFPDALLEAVKEAHKDNLTTQDIDAMFKEIDIDVISVEQASDIESIKRLFEIASRVFDVEESDFNYEDKEIGDEVMLTNPLFTNMIVSSDGMQLSSESPIIPAAPELVGKKAFVVATDCDATYLCAACDNPHRADVQIEFEDFNIKFHVNGDFLRMYEEGNELKTD